MSINVTKIRPFWLLIIGIASLSITHLTLGVNFFAWFANVPFLLYLSLTKGWKTKFLFVFALIAAWSFAILKILSPPMPFVMIFLFSIPISLFHLPAYLLWDRFSQTKWSVLLFPAVFTIMEWIQYSFTPFGTWGITAYTQTSNISIMQFSSVFGIAGLSFLIHWINASIARVLTTHKTTQLTLHLPVSILVLVIIFGSLRLDLGKSKGIDTMTVAAIGTDSDVGGLPLPSKESNDSVISNLLRRTEKAADFGAKLAVWTEGAFYALPDEEQKTIDLIRSVAKEKGIPIYAAYIVPLSEDTFRYENKYVYINQYGEDEYTYFKHQPVPGEPAIQGTEPFQTFEINEINVGGAICYDYDFPYIAQEYGQLNTDIVALPSSDWRGIDPLHTRMAAFRAVEQGHSIVRSTRFGLSANISPYGEMLGQASSFDNNNKILISDIPAKRVSTLYSVIGDLFVYMCLGFVVAFFILRLSKIWNN